MSAHHTVGAEVLLDEGRTQLSWLTSRGIDVLRGLPYVTHGLLH